MNALTDTAFQKIEGKMHNYQKLRRRMLNDRADLLYGSVGVDYNTPTGHSKHADSTAQKAIRLMDGSEETKWVDAVEKTHAYFQGQPEAEIIKLLYAQHHNIAAASKISGLHRGTVRRMRDTVLTRCAMHAAAYGLIDLDRDMLL